MRKARPHHFGVPAHSRRNCPQSRPNAALGVLQRLIQHFAAGDEVGEDAA